MHQWVTIAAFQTQHPSSEPPLMAQAQICHQLAHLFCRVVDAGNDPRNIHTKFPQSFTAPLRESSSDEVITTVNLSLYINDSQ